MHRLCRRLLLLGVAGLAAALAVLAVRRPPLAAVAGLAGLIAFRRRAARGEGVYGTARWCTADDPRTAGLL